MERARRGCRWRVCSGENGQDVLMTLETALLYWLSAQRKQFFIAVLTALVIT